jgi:hypothetical protein
MANASQASTASCCSEVPANYLVLACSNTSRKDAVTGEWRKLPNEELNDLYSVPNIVRVFKSRRMRWAGHVARMGE